LAISDSDEGGALFTQHGQGGRQIQHPRSRKQKRIRHIQAEDATKTNKRRHVGK
jgi:hypothetical protein